MSAHSAPRLKRVAAGSLATAVALSAFGIAATPAVAAPDVVRVHLAEIGKETTSYPANKWFIGASNRPGIGAAIVDDRLVMKPFTQVLTQLKGADLPASVAEIIEENVSVDITDPSEGDVALQIALGWQGGWTTLRPGFQNADDLDGEEQWISSRPIGVGGPTTGTLGELAAAVDASVDATDSGTFAYAAVGALVNNDPGEDTSIDSITVNDVTYAFVDGLPAVASTVPVDLSAIGTETAAGHPATPWFYGAGAATADPIVVAGNLVLPAKKQLLHAVTGVTSLRSLVSKGLAVTTTDATVGTASLQIAAGWAGGWTTLRPAAATVGENVADFGAEWISSKPLAGGVTTGTLDQLVGLVDTAAAGSFGYVAVGAFADTATGTGETTVSSLQIGTEKTTFVAGLPATTSTSRIQLSEIGTETANGYPATPWFFGAGAATAKPTVVAGNLVLPAKKQLLHAVSGVTSLRSLVSQGLAVTTTDATVGTASLQIAAGWTGGWTTLRPAAATTGENVADFGAAWISSKPLTGGVTTGTLAQLTGLIDTAAAGSFAYVAVGAFADTATGTGQTTVSSLRVGTEKVTFANDARITASVAVTGVKAVGNTLTANVTANFAATSKKYQWYRNGTAIKNATRASYALTSSDLAKRITVTVTVSRSGLVKKAVTSPKISSIALGTLAFSAPTQVTGTPKVGVKLTASALARGVGSNKTATGYSYAWYRNGVLIKGAVARTYVPTAADLGKVVGVKVTGKLAGYANAAVRNEPLAAVVPGTFVVGTPKINGKRVVGQTLVVAPGAWSAAPTLRYAFYADGELVQYSTSPKLVLTWEHKGHSIAVQVTGSKQGYTTASTAISPTTAAIK